MTEENNTGFELGDRVMLNGVAGPDMIVGAFVMTKARGDIRVRCEWFERTGDYSTSYVHRSAEFFPEVLRKVGT